MNLFRPEGKLHNALCKLADCVCLSLIWFIMSLPIITLGASTTALYTTTEVVIKKESGPLLSTFWKAFKGSFKQSTFAFVAIVFLLLVMGANYYFVINVFADSLSSRAFIFLMTCVSIAVAMWTEYLLYYFSKFSGTIREVMKNTFIISLVNPFWTILLLVISVCSLIIVLSIPVSILFLPVVYALVRIKIYDKVFRKYLVNQKTCEKC